MADNAGPSVETQLCFQVEAILNNTQECPSSRLRADKIVDLVKGVLKNSVTIGDYTIGPCSHGGFWIGHESGEGTQVHEPDMVKLIDDFYEKIF